MFFAMQNSDALKLRVTSYDSAEALLEATPPENTIGVVGSFEGYVISGTEPENPTVKLLWVQVDSASPVKFQATKKNPLFLHPIKSHIYDGEWKVVESHLYLNAKWNVFGRQYLCHAGKYNEALTGGHSTGYVPYSGSEVGYIAVTQAEDHRMLDASTEKWGSGATLGAMFTFKNMVDLTHYKTLVFTGWFDKENANSHALYGCWAADGENDWASVGSNYREKPVKKEERTAYSNEPVVIDVSDLTGKHLIGIGMRSCKIRLNDCYLEM